MSDISEHYSKEERVGHDVEGSRVHFLVIRLSIGFHNFMEGPDEVVDLEVSGRLEFVAGDLGDLSHPGAGSVSD
jgi:hypothetical protein